MKLINLFFLFASALFLLECTANKNEGNGESTLFRNLPASETNIDFRNELVFKQEFNIYRYRNFYNGGGVALGDINNDGLLDIFFTSNMGGNKLYLNNGDMKFEDITAKAAVAGERAWSTGVSIADVNGDGLVDIYVCNSGIVEGDDRKNELYINNGDLTFTEMAEEYGIADDALSIHGTFFDYDKDGDLDLYLANNSYRAIGSFDLQKTDRNIRDEQGGDKLYRNDGGHFTEVSSEAGIYSSEFGFALGASVGDVNRDGWPDVYISNDFFERDYLYINNRDGSFNEVLEEAMNSISAASMGADIADLNDDGYPEIFVTDMLPESETRLKLVTTFDDWEGYREYVENGFHHQFTRNTLQYNNTDGTFSEIGRWAGVEATDWSWGANIADFDLDGRRDIFVANGIYRDLTNLDYLDEISKEEVQRKIVRDNDVDFKQLVDLIPQTPISNYAFHNLGNMQFADSSAVWGLDEPGFSNGSAYGDLDNDGDLDLVINNIESEASVYENRATEVNPDNGWLQISFKGANENKFAFGAQVTAWAGDRRWFAEQMPVRGFQSTMDHRLHLGLGEIAGLDSLVITWPDESVSKFENLETNQMLTVDQNKSSKEDGGSSVLSPSDNQQVENTLLKEVTNQFDINWKHRENEFIDFKRDRLLFHMRSTEGPALCVGDADGDGLEDFYVGGAKDQAGALFLQNDNSKFTPKKVEVLEEDASAEDVDCVFFDADGDGLMDLYVASGGNEFPSSSSSLADRLYINQGQLSFERSKQPLPSWSYESTSVVRTADYDNDGDSDLFVGVRLKPFAVGFPARGYLLENDGQGIFKDVTEEIAPGMMEMGMTTDAVWTDMEGDGYPDLWVAGEWMPLTFFDNKEGALEQGKFPGLDTTSGWWHSLAVDDLDGDGYFDIVAGNHGMNSRFRASGSKPIEMWTGDLNKNGTVEQVISAFNNQKRYPMALRHNLMDEIPYLNTKYPSFKSFTGETIDDIFTDSQLEETHYSRVNQLASIVAWNNGNKEFRIEELPFQAQLSPVYGNLSIDLTGNGESEIVMGGNLHNVKPEVGRYDAGYGIVLTRENNFYKSIMSRESGFHVQGEIRAVKKVELQNGVSILIVARNDDSLKFFEIRGDNARRF